MFLCRRFYSVVKIDQSAVLPFQDKANLWWKAESVNCWLLEKSSGLPIGMLELHKSVFASTPIRQDLMKRAIAYESSWREQGTESTKNLGQVRGSTRKPFQQKGRGKARVGTLRAPNFRGGYAVHGDRPHIKTTDIQRKVYDAAIRAALSTKFIQSQMYVVDSLALETDKKSELQSLLDNLNISGRKCYFAYGNEEPEKALVRACNKFQYKPRSEECPLGERALLVSSARNISCGAIMEFELLIVDKAALEVFEQMYKIAF